LAPLKVRRGTADRGPMRLAVPPVLLVTALFGGQPRCRGVDDTAAVQKALDRDRIVKLPSGACVVRPLQVPSNRIIEFQRTTILKAKPGYGEEERLLNVVDVSNVTIRGNGGAVAMNGSEYVSGEQRHAVFIAGA